jgi:7-cyano-7-deazaguanine synthase in queuosine biosynthesis
MFDLSKLIDDATDKNAFSEENVNKPIYVIWSGGCDSTCVLDDLLSNLKAFNDKRKVNTISFSHWQIGDAKMTKEAMARSSYLHYCAEKQLPIGLCKTIEIPRYEVKLGREGGCPQVALWLTSAIPLVPDNSLLYTGYHKGDDFFTYDVLKNWGLAFEGLCKLYGKKITPMFPYKYKTKTEIIKQLQEKNIINLTWHCEIPNFSDGSACGYCEPCKRHIESVKGLEYYEEQSKKSVIDAEVAAKKAWEEKLDQEKQIKSLVDAGTLKETHYGCYEIVQRKSGDNEAQVVS